MCHRRSTRRATTTRRLSPQVQDVDAWADRASSPETCLGVWSGLYSFVVARVGSVDALDTSWVLAADKRTRISIASVAQASIEKEKEEEEAPFRSSINMSHMVRRASAMLTTGLGAAQSQLLTVVVIVGDAEMDLICRLINLFPSAPFKLSGSTPYY
ncbi:hypothetical protein ASPZODRAFT_144899 [Penicilliopsis zonata CBS 506.65]|uniref:Uncharacterized protein n=1 Tax=Penicilliopsis zonata CBS 506.65 TaxID=1073090 RepID=A0A1L9SAW1_9EURO|nr:hypothetical protein ASPZODRAFT_144899 [Penicilliopsis zonata CBS 506.65]OJJ44322.1 hypothetical protein ASPZODRAFT_144899 [Penicilliopsis zonata CBS 506.65]